MTIFRDILCVLDTAEDCTPALDRAVSLAENNQANLTVVDVVEKITLRFAVPAASSVFSDLQPKMVAARTQELDALVEPYRQRIPINTQVLTGTRFLEIIREVLGGKHDLVIKMPEKLTWLERLFGSDDMNLLRMCPCPVWLVKPQKKKSYGCILAAVDVYDEYPPEELEIQYRLNQEILAAAASLALSEFAELHIVYAWHARSESAMRGAYMHTTEAEIDAYLEQERRRHEVNLEALTREISNEQGQDRVDYLKPKTHLLKGWARKEIPAMAKELTADVIVMGTVARTGIPGIIMGNTAETILNQIDCSVLAIKPPGFETPVKVKN
ncbi:MAG: universal stress protein [Halioglobus sp.]|jgi:nucleotide-binding universal stress UspA family protein|nr:universal stress protein [Halioglobus sp.]